MNRNDLTQINHTKIRRIAIIPARSGSKGLKDKNIKELNGKPLLAYTVEAAKRTGLFDTIHVSTDSRKYAEIAAAFGADEPFLRDEQNASDSASSWDVIREALIKYAEIGCAYEVCALLQPTSPLRSGEDIKAAFELFEGTKARSLTSVVEVEHPIQWCFTLDDTCLMKDFASSPYRETRRQDLERHYRENGAIYIAKTRDVIDQLFEFYSDQCVAYIMDQHRSIDIDTWQDFLIAEIIMKTTMGANDGFR